MENGKEFKMGSGKAANGGDEPEKDFDWTQVGEKETVRTPKGIYVLAKMKNSKGSMQIAVKKASLDADGLPKGEVRHLWMPAEDLPAVLEGLQKLAK